MLGRIELGAPAVDQASQSTCHLDEPLHSGMFYSLKDNN